MNATNSNYRSLLITHSIFLNKTKLNMTETIAEFSYQMILLNSNMNSISNNKNNNNNNKTTAAATKVDLTAKF